ncbi:hypothetical protein HPP92_000485 [Vanilla planifolia]|uniref:KNOX1 domain-containing protein n=1 Tax=Vanilla planifolia TaxID=51239 RepID=A0A835RUI9_VANPL|nr:hypothetical protein HPP92_000485 [Vanilla planifolia]
MAYHNHLAQELSLPPYSDHGLDENPAVITAILPDVATGKPAAVSSAAAQHLAGRPSWLSRGILREQPHQFVDGSFLHLQTASDSSTSPSAASASAKWIPAISNDSMIAAAMSDPGTGGDVETTAGGEHQAVEGTWQNARYKAEILAHPLYEQLLSAHVACLRIATPVDQLPRIDAQLAQSQHVVAKYSVLGAGGHGGQIIAGDDKVLDQFMAHYVLLLCSFKEQLQQHVRVHAMEAVMACWELEQSLQSLTGVSPGEGTGATMSDDEDDDLADSETNFYDGSFDGPECMGFGPLVPTESERSLMERVRQELKSELKKM